MKSNICENFQGYKVLPLKILPNSKSNQLIYMKEHYIKGIEEKKPKGRTLFLLNVPPYIKKDHLKKFFEEKVGDVVSVAFSQKPGKDEEGVAKFESTEDIFFCKNTPFIFKCAYIVFKSTKFLQEALEISEMCFYEECFQSFKFGTEKWTASYFDNIIPESQLQTEIDTYMAEYDANENSNLQADKSKTDNDGWTKVGKYGKNAGFEQKESVINKLEDKMQKNKKKRELKNFYTFQIRESKMQNIVSLRKKFEEDKKKIELLKKSRRFKPF